MAEVLAVIAFPIAVYQTLEKFYEFGKLIADRIKTYKHVPEIVARIRNFMIDMREGRLKDAIEISKWMYQQSDLEVDAFTKERVSSLLEKLKSGCLAIDGNLKKSFKDNGELQKLSFAVTYERQLKSSMRQLENHHKELWDEVQILAHKKALVPDPLLLASPEPFSPKGHWDEVEKGCILKKGLADFSENGRSRAVTVLVEDLIILTTNAAAPTNEAHPHVNEVKKIAQQLCIELKKAEGRSNGMLRCLGYREAPMELVFEFPAGFTAPKTLRQLLNDSHTEATQRAPLEYRSRLAQELSEACFSLLVSGYVHKNIRADSIVIFSKEGGEPDKQSLSEKYESLSPAYLTDWKKLRAQKGNTTNPTDDDWAMNFYRHFMRQGLAPQSRYEPKHDLYSLGVCFLEVGLWEPFIVFKDGHHQLSDFFHSEALKIEGVEEADFKNMNALASSKKLGQIFVQIAERLLPEKMGTPFSKLTINCLKDEVKDKKFFDGDENLAALSFRNAASTVLEALPRFGAADEK